MGPIKHVDSFGNLKMRRKRAPTQVKEKQSGLDLVEIQGLSHVNPNTISLHPNSEKILYIAGSTLVIYDWGKHQQGPFLIAGKENCSLEGIEKEKEKNVIRPLVSAQFSLDGRWAAVGESGHNPRVLVWDMETEKYVAELKGHKFGIQSLGFLPQTKYLVSLGYQHDGVLNLWNWKSGAKLASNRVSNKVSTMAISGSGEFCVTAGLRHIKFWYFKNLNDHNLTNQIIEGRSAVLGRFRTSNFVDVTCLSEDNGILCYAITSDGYLCAFDKSRKVSRYLDLKVKYGYSISYNKGRLICGCSDGIVRLFDATSLTYLGSLPRPHPLGIDVEAFNGKVYKVPKNESFCFPSCETVALNFDGTKVVTFYSDHSYYIWDVTKLTQVSKLRSSLFHSDVVWNLDFIELGDKETFELVSCSSDGSVRFWNLDSQAEQKNIFSRELVKVIHLDPKADSRYQLPKVQPNENLNPNLNDSLKVDLEDKVEIRCIRLTSDNRYLISGDRNGNLRVHEMGNFEQINYQEAHDGEIMDIDVLTMVEDDNVYYSITSASRDRLIHVFNMSSTCFKLIQTLGEHSSAVTSVRFLDSGNRLISCSADKSAIFRSSVERVGLPYYTAYHHYCGKATLYNMEVDHMTNSVSIVTQDKRLLQFNSDSGKLITRIKPTEELEDFTMTKVTLDSSGMFAAVASSDKIVRLMELTTGNIVGIGIGHSEMITSVKFTPDCKHIITTSGDNCIFIWKIATLLSNQMQNRWSLLNRSQLDLKTNNLGPRLSGEWSEKEDLDELKKGGLRQRSNSVNFLKVNATPKFHHKIQKDGITLLNSNSKPSVQPSLTSVVKTNINHIKSPTSPLSKLSKIHPNLSNKKINVLDESNLDANILRIGSFIVDGDDEILELGSVIVDEIENEVYEEDNTNLNSPTPMTEDPVIGKEVDEELAKDLNLNFDEDKDLDLDINFSFSNKSKFTHTHRRSLSSRYLQLNPPSLSKNSSSNSSNQPSPINPSYIKYSHIAPRRLRRSRSSNIATLNLAGEGDKVNRLGVRKLIMPLSGNRPISNVFWEANNSIDNEEEEEKTKLEDEILSYYDKEKEEKEEKKEQISNSINTPLQLHSSIASSSSPPPLSLSIPPLGSDAIITSIEVIHQALTNDSDKPLDINVEQKLLELRDLLVLKFPRENNERMLLEKYSEKLVEIFLTKLENDKN